MHKVGTLPQWHYSQHFIMRSYWHICCNFAHYYNVGAFKCAVEPWHNSHHVTSPTYLHIRFWIFFVTKFIFFNICTFFLMRCISLFYFIWFDSIWFHLFTLTCAHIRTIGNARTCTKASLIAHQPVSYFIGVCHPGTLKHYNITIMHFRRANAHLSKHTPFMCANVHICTFFLIRCILGA